MGFKNFRLKIIMRVLGLAIFLFAFIYSMNQEQWYVTSAVSLLIAIILVIELIHFIENVNRELSKFLMSIKNKDFTASYHEEGIKKSAYADLKRAFQEITHEFQNVRIEKELHYQYLQTVFSHSKTAILCYNDQNEIVLINDACKELLGIHRIQKLSQLERINPKLLHIIESQSLDIEQVHRLTINQQIKHLNIQHSTFKLKEEQYDMLSLHDIRTAMDQQELDSWKKLIRVLNHEIMNSVTPISSLSNALNKMINPSGEAIDLAKLDEDDKQDLIDSLETIESRSKGLINFVTNYKKLTKLPKPNFSEINIFGMLNHLHVLMRSRLDEANIQLKISCDKDLILEADHELIEQVLLNMLLNAIQAINEKEDAKISINAYDENGHIHIDVIDNGCGISDEDLDQIFVPFFTTKRSGSGIGLSLSRQIMQLHKGKIQVHSKIGDGSQFSLVF